MTKIKYSFAQWCRDNGHKDWLDLWDYELNDVGPDEISCGAKKKCFFKCHDCEALFQKRLDYIIHYGLRCSSCGDGISYPNKYVREFLNQLKKIYNFDIYSEHVFEWSKHIDENKSRRLYDFVIEDNQNIVIIEVHGRQHFYESFLFDGARTLLEEQENDLFKYNLAMANGVRPENYIIIDAKESNDLWIKKSIINCGIKNIYTFQDDDIDWIKCNQFASSNVAKQICDKYTNGDKNINTLCQSFDLDKKTIQKYLKQGTKNGWCDYIPKVPCKQSPIICLENNLIFASESECARLSEDLFGVVFNQTGISQMLSKKTDSYKGYHFKKISIKDFQIQKDINPNIVFGDLY